MSFKGNDTITGQNYEEYFILYVDNELSAAQKAAVDAFVLQHPQLGEELDLLMATKLTVDKMHFAGKEELLSSAMKVAAVDESLLLYVDNELPSAEREAVEKKIAANKDYALQYALLMQVKLDATETLLHPDKKELHRHEKRVVPFGIWMRIAAAVIVLLFGSLFFLLNNGKHTNTVGDTAAITPNVKTTKPALTERLGPAEQVTQQKTRVDEQTAAVKTSAEKPSKLDKPFVQKSGDNDNLASVNADQNPVVQRKEVIHFDASHFTKESNVDVTALNNKLTTPAVTSALNERTIIDEGEPEPAVTDGDFKDTRKTPARGFFRKVSRFIERKAGIGTVNADNELLIGAVALKLK